MLLKRYREVTDRCLELGAKMDSITVEERGELRRLLEEQAWLSKNIARQANSALEEVRQALEHIESWVSESLGLVERALDQKGIPSDILALGEIISQAAEIRDRARNLMVEDDCRADSGGDIVYKNDKQCPPGADIRIECLSDEDLLSGQAPEEKAEQEISSGTEEVAASSVSSITDSVQYLPPSSDDHDGKKVVQEEAGGMQEINSTRPKLTVFQTPEPLTYKLPREVVDNLEKKLDPQLLPGKALASATTLPGNNRSKSKKTRAKKSKKKKK